MLTLTALEIVLGVDNVIFISILANKLPPEQRDRARVVGLGGALVMRVLLLLSISFLVGLTSDLFEIAGHGFSGRDLILLIGGLFLLYKATTELHEKIEGTSHAATNVVATSFAATIAQIMVLDLVFSLDSVITAVGMADELGVMIAAVIIAVGVMLFAAKSISEFVERHPTVKVLGLAFLLMIGLSLVAEGFGQHISKGYIYTAMAFSVAVEVVNLRVKSVSVPPGDGEKPNFSEDTSARKFVERHSGTR
ncbi:MAG: TerC family protein [Thermomicrobiales bacterium]